MGADFWIGLLTIIGVNLVLAGDNAIVIAMAARDLPAEVQRRAIVLGTVLAVALRVVLTVAVVLLLEIPAVRIVGGLALLVIAWRLGVGDEDPDVTTPKELRAAVITILAADLAMSIDNVLAVAAAANGSFVLIAVGLAISIPIVTVGASLLLGLMKRFPVIVWIGVALVAYTGMELIVSDPYVHDLLDRGDVAHWMEVAAGLVVTAVITSWAWLAARRARAVASARRRDA